ncbi:Histone deacetylase 5 [Ananas comosus]|uniref:histone deacetylase n=1 Tax=Ananas comosus TaxID=4615 RepID=A0A199V6W8_ANACO|nr:Histone deacetylase 5 [Ananas comosus]
MAAPETPPPPPPSAVGLVYDERMCSHATPDGESHPENPERLRAIWRKLEAEGITKRCVLVKAKEAEDQDIASVHSQNHIKLIRSISSKQFDSRRNKIARRFNSIYFNEGSSESAYLAAGSVIEAAEKVAKGELNSAIALVRPPGHHAEHNEAMGFCLFNNVAIAVSFLLKEPELGIKKILIVDWDVHHGNGTQNTFYKDPHVLFFSVHRFDFGTFYPAGGDGSHCMVGEGPGQGYNINVPWEHGRCGDADYLAVWDHVLIPVAEAYNPDIVMISAGFDAALGDPLGGCCITPYGYSLLLKKLITFARGKIVMVLEGGYNLKSIANSVFACAKVLLGEEPSLGSVENKPFESTWRVIQAVRDELKTYWPVLGGKLPEELLAHSRKLNLAELNFYSSSESDEEDLHEPSASVCSVNVIEVAEDDLSSQLSRLNVDGLDHAKGTTSNHSATTKDLNDPLEASHNVTMKILDGCVPWRSALLETYVWYASYGSNMWRPRFLCYIEGGKVEGMSQPCCGSRDRSSPKDVAWKTVPHRLFFGRSFTRSWGPGGVAFLHPESNSNEKAHICMYKITLEQFNDLLFQENCLVKENCSIQQIESPLFNLSSLDFVSENKSLHLEVLKDGWYSNVLYLGKEDDLPILTMTCGLSDFERFKSGEVPLTAPAKGYVNTLVKGLTEGKQLSEAAAIDYINDATVRKL